MRPEDVQSVGVVGAGTMGAGVAQVCATAGLQTVLVDVVHADLGDDKYRPAPLLCTYVAAGWLGRKNGRGVYTYD